MASAEIRTSLEQLRRRAKRPQAGKKLLLLEQLLVSVPAVLIVIWDEDGEPFSNVLPKELTAVLTAYEVLDRDESLERSIMEFRRPRKHKSEIHELTIVRPIVNGNVYKVQLKNLAGVALIPSRKACFAFFFSDAQKERWSPNFVSEIERFVKKAHDIVETAEIHAIAPQVVPCDDPAVGEKFLESALYTFKRFIEQELFAEGCAIENLRGEFTFTWLRRYPGFVGDEYGYFLTRDQLNFLRNHFKDEADEKISDIRHSRYRLGIGLSPYVGATRVLEYTENWPTDLRVDTPDYPGALRDLERDFLSNVLLQIPLIIETKVEFILMIATKEPLGPFWHNIVLHLFEHRPLIELSMNFEKVASELNIFGAVPMTKMSGHVFSHRVDSIVTRIEKMKFDPGLSEFTTRQEFKHLLGAINLLKESSKEMANLGSDSRLLIVDENRGEHDFEVADVVRQAFDAVMFDEVHMNLDLECPDIMMWGNKEYLGFMFEEFFINARRHTKAIDKHIKVKIVARDELLFIFVIDNGAGDSSLVDLVEPPPMQTTDRYGLNVIWRVAKLHCGKVGYVQSDDDNGTVALVVLPRLHHGIDRERAKRMYMNARLAFDSEKKSWIKARKSHHKTSRNDEE